MYLSIGIILLALVLCTLFAFSRRRAAIKKVCALSSCEKSQLLSNLIAPFGYCYNEQWDLISSRIDAWQRTIGYTALFDRAAASLNMVFNYLPIYFTYQNRTWLIEFWKGQYGINTGGEIGIYYADEILPEDALPTAHFQAVDDQDMLPVSFSLFRGQMQLAEVSKRTWWLTAFCMGIFSSPEQLSMKASIRFLDRDMTHSFLNALYKAGIKKDTVSVCGCEIQFCFGGSDGHHYGWFRRLLRKCAQLWNCFFCKVYLKITAPFCMTIDRILYLYYLLPSILRRVLSPRKYRKCRKYKNM